MNIKSIKISRKVIANPTRITTEVAIETFGDEDKIMHRDVLQLLTEGLQMVLKQEMDYK